MDAPDELGQDEVVFLNGEELDPEDGYSFESQEYRSEETESEDYYDMDSCDEVDPLINEEGRALSEAEHQLALELKQAVEAHGELKPLTDFEYAKHAVVAGGDLQAALLSVERMQALRDVYKVDHSVEQGVRCLEALMNQQPGFILHFDVNENHETINVADAGCLYPDVALKGQNWRDLIRGLYYLHFVSQPSIKSARQGFYNIVDFGDLSSKNFNMEVQYQIFSEISQGYPFNTHALMAFHTGTLATMRLTLVKRFMPRHLSEKVKLGCQIDESDESRSPTGRLKDFYLLPNLEGAQQKMLARARVLLELRAWNEQELRL